MLDGFALAAALQDGAPDGGLLRHVLSALLFAGIGVVVFAVAFIAIVKAMPFSVRKEIEEDQNVALAILFAAVILGIAVVVGMAVKG
jgi:putative membrane protein